MRPSVSLCAPPLPEPAAWRDPPKRRVLKEIGRSPLSDRKISCVHHLTSSRSGQDRHGHKACARGPHQPRRLTTWPTRCSRPNAPTPPIETSASVQTLTGPGRPEASSMPQRQVAATHDRSRESAGLTVGRTIPAAHNETPPELSPRARRFSAHLPSKSFPARRLFLTLCLEPSRLAISAPQCLSTSREAISAPT
jgi:hypothetical protein